MGLLEYTPGKVILLHRRPFWLKEAGDWATLAPTRLANDARASTASQSGKSKGEASPPIVHTLPAPTREQRVPRTRRTEQETGRRKRPHPSSTPCPPLRGSLNSSYFSLWLLTARGCLSSLPKNVIKRLGA